REPARRDQLHRACRARSICSAHRGCLRGVELMDGRRMKKLCEALCRVFTHDELAQLLKFHLDKNMNERVRADNLFNEVFQLTELASREGWLGDLIRAAHEERPGDSILQSIYTDYRQEVLVGKVEQVQSKLDELKR